MKKWIIAAVILLILLPNAAFAQTEHEKTQQDAAQIMVKLGLLKGYGDGELKLANNITRAEFATIIMRMMGYEAKPFNVSSSISFKDLSKKHWAYSTIRMAASLGYLKGYPDKTFGPSKNITYAEAVTVMVRILGYDSQLEGKWPDNYINKADGIGILKNLDISPNKPITRGDICILVVNSLPVELKK